MATMTAAELEQLAGNVRRLNGTWPAAPQHDHHHDNEILLLILIIIILLAD